MKKIRGIFFLLFVPVIWSSCASTKLTRRYCSATTVSNGSEAELVRVSAFVLDVPPSPPKSFLLDLSPQAQSTLIGEIAKKTASMESFLSSLQDVGVKENGGGDIIDMTRFRKRVIFSVEKGGDKFSERIGPADRIGELLIQMSIPAIARFHSWSRFETKYESIDLGKVSFTQGSQAGLSGTMIPQTSLLPATIPGTMAFNRSIVEEILLKQRYIAISGSLAPQDARLYQQGAMGIDLTGNFFIDFDIRLDNSQVGWKTMTLIENLSEKGIPNPGDKVRVGFKTLKYPNQSAAVTCSLVSHFLLRHVQDKAQTVIEGDDVVQFISGEGGSKFELLGEADLKTRIYSVRSHHLQKGDTSKDGFELHFKGFKETPIYFLSFGMARDFLNWLKEKRSTRVAQFSLQLNSLPLEVNDISGLEIEVAELN